MNFVKLEAEVPDQGDGFGSRTLFIKSTAITAVATDLADGVWVYFDGRVLFVSATAEELLERINAVQV